MTPERYLGAVVSSHLKEGRDIDMLTAAGMSSGHALSMLRLTHNRASFAAVVAEIVVWLKREAKRRGLRDGGKHSAALVVAPMVAWRVNQHCRHCRGRGYPVIQGAPVLDASRPCRHCAGTGKVPLRKVVRPEFLDAAELISSEFDRGEYMAFSRIRGLLKR